MNEQERFPIGGPREPVYAFLRLHGFIMSDWTDKYWYRADGITLHLYGAGSRAWILNRAGKVISNDELEKGVASLKDDGPKSGAPKHGR